MTTPGGAEQVIAFALVLCICIGVVGLVCTTLLGRRIERNLREGDARRAGELDGLADRFVEAMHAQEQAWARSAAERDRVLVERLRGAGQPERRRIRGLLAHKDDVPRGDGASGIGITYEPAPTDDAAMTLRERAG